MTTRPDEPRAGVPPPFFIVGAQRSGTSLLRLMFVQHPEVAIPPETDFIPQLWRRRRSYGRGGAILDRDRFLSDLQRHEGFRRSGLSVDAVTAEMERLEARPSVIEGISSVFRAYARDRGRSVWGDKTPEYTLHVDLIGRLWPDARVIHIVRDGRDVALSMMDLGRLHFRAASAALTWSRMVSRCRKAGRRLGSTRYIEVRYEDLVDRPVEELRSLCAFLGLRFDPRMNGPAVPGGRDRSQKRLRLPPVKGLRDWRTEMDKRDIEEFEAIARYALEEFGYEIVAPRSAIRRAVALSRLVPFGLRLVASKTSLLGVYRRARRKLTGRPAVKAR